MSRPSGSREETPFRNTTRTQSPFERDCGSEVGGRTSVLAWRLSAAFFRWRSVISIGSDGFGCGSLKVPATLLPRAITVMLAGYAAVVRSDLLMNGHSTSHFITELEIGGTFYNPKRCVAPQATGIVLWGEASFKTFPHQTGGGLNVTPRTGSWCGDGVWPHNRVNGYGVRVLHPG